MVPQVLCQCDGFRSDQAARLWAHEVRGQHLAADPRFAVQDVAPHCCSHVRPVKGVQLRICE